MYICDSHTYLRKIVKSNIAFIPQPRYLFQYKKYSSRPTVVTNSLVCICDDHNQKQNV